MDGPPIGCNHRQDLVKIEAKPELSAAFDNGSLPTQNAMLEHGVKVQDSLFD